MGHTHGVLTGGGSISVDTFPNEYEENKFLQIVNIRATDEFNKRLPENEGKTFSEVRSMVFDALMYVYISRELVGFSNYDEPFIPYKRV